MSSNIPYSTADPRRHQDEDDQHDHDVPGHRISSPDHVDVKIPHAAGAVPSQQSRARTSTVHLERVLPLWTPKRLRPGSRFNQPSTLSAQHWYSAPNVMQVPLTIQEGLVPARNIDNKCPCLSQEGVNPMLRSHRQHAGLECRHRHWYWWQWCASGAGDGIDPGVGK